MTRPHVTGFLHEPTNTVTYVVGDPESGRCVVIDPALDFDPASGRTGTDFAAKVVDFVKEKDWTCDMVMETHIHADHLSAAPYMKDKLGGDIVAGFNLRKVQSTFAGLFGEEADDVIASDAFDRFLEDGEEFTVGAISARTIWTPGHTPACMSYLIGDALFTGDAMFMPDFGTGRCDFPGGDARALYRSSRKIFELPEETRIFVGHDYGGEGRGIAWETTVGAEKAKNKHVNASVSEDEFVKFRVERDATLPMPRLILPSVQVNMRGGVLPPADENGVRYLKIPLDAL